MIFKLTTLQDTYFKTQPVDSSKLPDNQKLLVPIDSQFAPLSWAYADNNHISFNVTPNLILYAFTEHISLTKDGSADLGKG